MPVYGSHPLQVQACDARNASDKQMVQTGRAIFDQPLCEGVEVQGLAGKRRPAPRALRREL